ncbi:unnamed protein product [Darwinula stevensoni]|uniref:G-protein coupled receptors family 1 profile domain-containing protein n=1 Tax=Darwinula stevensoni TaxID=69355 RepID=A0A7R9FRS8_9CRUS|nr:unnamed protein product [Darwinula stevensoni]CAG0902057.1 unnamed protein product [Darwinula stevensoni]
MEENSLEEPSFPFANVTNDSSGWELMEKYKQNQKVSETALATLACCYALLILVGSLGNALVVLTVARKRAMRTPRNLFIFNLAVSDLFLCLFTMPFTLYQVTTMIWNLGWFPCKLVGFMQATSIFVSTLTITAIALDRCYVITNPTREGLMVPGVLMVMGVIWLAAITLASPLFVFQNLISFEFNIENYPKHIQFCFEDWPITRGRAMYSIFSFVFQYIIPIATVSTAYTQIYFKLQGRLGTGILKESSQARQEREDIRIRRTNKLLLSIALIFCVSWLPLNLFNLFVDLFNPFEDKQEEQAIIFAVCHMLGMSSACFNPLLYGWLNENFQREFLEVFALLPCRKRRPRENNVQEPRAEEIEISDRQEVLRNDVHRSEPERLPLKT